MTSTFLQKFFKLESASGILLGIGSLIAITIANSALGPLYQSLLTNYHLNFIVNDGLMPIFFFLVGLEIKREIVSGELNSKKKIMLPAIAAICGMIFPALIYAALNYHDPKLLRGWAIPTATDIAFTLAVLSLLGKRVPLSLKIFLMALAIFDDLGAIIIISLFYSPQIHLTIVGVILAFLIPTKKIPMLEQKLHPWVAYFILPLFAFSNSGITLTNFSVATIFSSIPLGIILGLWLGKFLGIFSAVWLTVKTGLTKLPIDCTWKMMLGGSFLCGIGFTMSLFIGDLAFDHSMIELARLGVIMGSVVSGVCGYAILRTR